jgi:hypothetical protein
MREIDHVLFIIGGSGKVAKLTFACDESASW